MGADHISRGHDHNLPTVGPRLALSLGNGPSEDKSEKKRRCSASWARLISKVYDADPLTCRKCGGKLKVIAYLHDTVSIRRILEHLGLGQPEEERPPPPEVRYVPVDDEGWEIEAP